MTSNGLDTVQNKHIVSRRVSNNALQTMQNDSTWALALSKFLLASWLLATPAFCLIVMEHALPFFSLSFSAIFTSSHSLVFPTLPISSLGILPCLIHEWHACFTHHVPTAMFCYPEGVSTKPACNLLTHRAASSQLSSPITLNSWNGPLPDMRLVVIIMSFKEA